MNCNHFTNQIVTHFGQIITLCGSTRFSELYRIANLELTMAGAIVLSIGNDKTSDIDLHVTPEEKKMLERLHYQKMLMSEAIYVINKDGYIGESTKKEIELARQIGIDIYYYQDFYPEYGYMHKEVFREEDQNY